MEYVEQSHSLMSTLELCAKKATEKCSEEAAEQVWSEMRQLQSEWDAVKSGVAEAKARLESRRMELADYDDAVKRELMWMQDVERHLTDACKLCASLAEKKSRLQQTKVDKSSWCIVL